MLIAGVGHDSISEILFPNSLLNATNVNRNTISLNGRICSLGLPDFNQSYFNAVLNDDCEILEVNTPNIFTPNGDNVNDIFKIDGLQELDDVYIFNRWGIEIYSFLDINDGWNGRTSTGEMCTEGVYYYYVKRNDSVIKKGFIHLCY